MAISGLLGKAVTSPVVVGYTKYVVPYIAPADITSATININVVNAGTETATVTISISSYSHPPEAVDAIEYAYPLVPGGVMERTGIVVSASERVIVNSDQGNVAIRIHGFEEV